MAQQVPPPAISLRPVPVAVVLPKTGIFTDNHAMTGDTP